MAPMGYKHKEDHAARELARYYEKRGAAVAQLGGCCAQCGLKEGLEFDHIDPTTKSFNVSSFWSVSRSRLQAELEKCQLLCKEHHKEKTVRERGGPGKHGDLAMYRHGRCRCELCRTSWNKYHREYKRRKRRERAEYGA